MKYGIELEYFITDKDGKIIPAYKITNNVDGNPVIGEIRTGVHDNIVDCIYELKKLIYLEKIQIEKKGFLMVIIPETKVSDDFTRSLRKDINYINSKNTRLLDEKSIYPKGKTSKILSRGLYKASLQLNISENKYFSYSVFERQQIKEEYTYNTRTEEKGYGAIFDYLSILFLLDENFEKELRETSRIKGVYAIKSGKYGDRIEYRSLPNNVDLDKILEVLK